MVVEVFVGLCDDTSAAAWCIGAEWEVRSANAIGLRRGLPGISITYTYISISNPQVFLGTKIGTFIPMELTNLQRLKKASFSNKTSCSNLPTLSNFSSLRSLDSATQE